MIEQAPWFAIAHAEMAQGVVEIPGKADNQRIVAYHATTSLEAEDDETPWCSSFVNWCMVEADIPGTNSARARSWVEWGRPLYEPRLGCVVVFSRPPSPTAGHVGFFCGQDPDRIYVLGGNQSNTVNITAYPKDRWLGYFWPVKTRKEQ